MIILETTLTQTFFNEEFGELRTVQINDEIWFYAVDVCRILEIKNPSDAVSKTLEDDEKMTIDNIYSHSGKRGGAQKILLVNEPGLYRLIFQSRKPEAKKFQRWAFHEVIPKIRKTGSYSINNSINNFPPELSERWAKIKERENEVKAAEVLAKAARLTSSNKFREYLLSRTNFFINGEKFIEDAEDDLSDLIQ